MDDHGYGEEDDERNIRSEGWSIAIYTLVDWAELRRNEVISMKHMSMGVSYHFCPLGSRDFKFSYLERAVCLRPKVNKVLVWHGGSRNLKAKENASSPHVRRELAGRLERLIVETMDNQVRLLLSIEFIRISNYLTNTWPAYISRYISCYLHTI